MQRLTLVFLLLIVAFHSLIAQKPLKNFQTITAVAPLGDKVIFSANDGFHGNELWVSDGSPEGTKLLKDINPQYNSDPKYFTAFNGQLFFSAYHPQAGTELWKTDGTPEGTVMVKDLEPQNYYGGGSNPHFLTVYKDALYFRTEYNLYKSDGTTEGTEVIQEVSGGYFALTPAAGYLYLYADAANVFRTDGTSITTIPLPPDDDETNSGAMYFGSDEKLFALKSSTYYQVIKIYSFSEGENSWEFVKEFKAPIYGDQWIDKFTAIGDKVFFGFRSDYDNVPNSDELWVTDGTASGTLKLKSFAWDRHWSGSGMENFNVYKGNLFFRSGESAGKSLWKSDGTPTGTVKLHDVEMVTPQYDPNPAVISDGRLFFSGNNDRNYYNPELWSTDGSAAGTQLWADFNPNTGSLPHMLTDANGVLYFVTNEGTGKGLWNNMPSPQINVLADNSTIVPGGNVFFGNILLGDCIKKVITIRNAGLKELVISEVNVTGSDFFIKGDLPEIIRSKEQVTFDLFFNPLSKESKGAVLSIHTNDPNKNRFALNLAGQSLPTDVRGYCESFKDRELVKKLSPNAEDKSIALSNSTLSEGLPAGTVTGELTAQTLEGSITYSLVAGEGDQDNGKFILDGSQVKTVQVFSYDIKNVFTIRVRATGQTSSAEEFFVINIINAPESFTAGPCEDSFQRLDYGANDIEINSEGHIFVVNTRGKILRSLDNGSTWESINSGVPFRLNRIIFKESTGYILGDNVLLKSEDNGRKWFQVYLPTYTVSAFFLSDKTGFIGNSIGEVFKTGDGGKTWVKKNTSYSDAMKELWFWNEQEGIAIKGNNGLVKTNDGGVTWVGISLSSIGYYNGLSGLFFKNSKDGFLVIYEKLYESKDGGNTWSQVSGIYPGSLAKIQFYDDSHGYIHGGYYGPSLFKTTDGGTIWESIAPPVSGRITGMTATTSGDLYATTSTSYSSSWNPGHGILYSADEGTSWEAKSELLDQSFTAIDFPTEETGFVFGEYGNYKTTDGGLTWKKLSYPTRLYESYFFDENNGLLSHGSGISKTSDGGETLEPVLTPEQTMGFSAGDLLVVNENVAFAYNWDVIYGTVDGGENWNLVAEDGFFQQDMQFISPQTGYSLELFGSVRKTTDGGITWDEIFTRDPDASSSFHKIYFVDETIGYMAGPEGRIRKTTDGGVTWENKFNYTYAQVIALYFTDALNGYLVGRNGRLYKTKDGAETWTETYLTSDEVYGASFKNGDMYFVGMYGFVGSISKPQDGPVQPGYISGKERACVGDILPYHLPAYTMNSYQWSAPGASVNDEGANALIGFPAIGEYMITARQYNECGISEERTIAVEVIEPETPLISGEEAVATGTENSIYEITNPQSGLFYAWDVTGALTFANENTPDTEVDWKKAYTEGSVNVIAIDLSAGCRASGKLAVTVGSVVGIEDEDRLLTAYPNPTQGDIIIQSHARTDLFVKITDVTGRTYTSKQLSPMAETTFSIRHASPGLYILEISDGINRVTKKIIKK